MEKKADVAARPARNSPAIGAKKAPKLYMVPKTTKPTVNATSTMTQARRESGRLASDGECRIDTFTTFLVAGERARIRSTSQRQHSGSCSRSIYWYLKTNQLAFCH